MTNEFTHDVFLSHSAKDKAVLRAFSLSAPNGGQGRGEVSKSPFGAAVADFSRRSR